MFIAFLILTIISAVVLIVGFVWMIASRGETTRRRGPEVGAEIMGGLDNDETEGVSATLREKSAFKGTGVSVQREASASFAEVKQLMNEGSRKAIPPLLAMGGLFFFLVFGAAALFAGLEDKVIAAIIVIPVLYTMARIARDFVKA